jgi:aspartyl-tRNA(Asn)/glutamyl-tRNA(Gln) amidotransferase subunit C
VAWAALAALLARRHPHPPLSLLNNSNQGTNPMSVDKQTVAKIASLARIKMSDEELERMAPELNNILEWVEQLSEVDTSNVAPMTAVIPNVLRLRDDVVDADPLTGGGKRDQVLANAPAAEHGFFGVPKVIE